MIDYFALAFGHGLIAVVLLRLVLRDGLDVDPLIAVITAETAANRKANSRSGRTAARRLRGSDDGGDGEDAAVDAEADEDPLAQAPRR